MIATQRNTTYFPGLPAEEQHNADAWLDDYLRLVIRIHRNYLARCRTLDIHRISLDAAKRTGRLDPRRHTRQQPQ